MQVSWLKSWHDQTSFLTRKHVKEKLPIFSRTTRENKNWLRTNCQGEIVRLHGALPSPQWWQNNFFGVKLTIPNLKKAEEGMGEVKREEKDGRIMEKERTNQPTNDRRNQRRGKECRFKSEREGDGKKKCVREKNWSREGGFFSEKAERKKNGWKEYTSKRRTKIVKETNLLALFDVQQKLANLLQLHYNMQYQSRIQYMA